MRAVPCGLKREKVKAEKGKEIKKLRNKKRNGKKTKKGEGTPRLPLTMHQGSPLFQGSGADPSVKGYTRAGVNMSL